MCGRYPQHTKPKRLAELFNARLTHGMDNLPARYNIAPTTAAPVIRMADVGRVIELMRWGLIPHWSREPKTTYATFNARSEDAASKASYRGPMRYRRCLVPADGFYEWVKNEGDKTVVKTHGQPHGEPHGQTHGKPHGKPDGHADRNGASKTRQPYLIRMADEAPFVMAGLWDCWGDELQSFAILTTQANEMMSKLHHRMPVIVAPENFDRWLAPNVNDPQAVADIMQPYPSELMFAVPVSDYVNNARNEGPACMERVA